MVDALQMSPGQREVLKMILLTQSASQYQEMQNKTA
jgi:hypothetical protein